MKDGSMLEKQRKDMTEAEVAESYQRRKGDMAGWIPLARPVRRRGSGATSTFAVRLTPEEIAEIKAASEASGVTSSEFIRNAALGKARERTAGGPATTARNTTETALWQAFNSALEDLRVQIEEAQRDMRAAVSEDRQKASA
jgi:hypothetical protein